MSKAIAGTAEPLIAESWDRRGAPGRTLRTATKPWTEKQQANLRARLVKLRAEAHRAGHDLGSHLDHAIASLSPTTDPRKNEGRPYALVIDQVSAINMTPDGSAVSPEMFEPYDCDPESPNYDPDAIPF